VSTYRPLGLLLPATISLLNWLASNGPLPGYMIVRRFGHAALDIYVLGSVVILAIAACLPATTVGGWAWILPTAGFLRLLDILVSGLRVIFTATSEAYAVEDARRTLLLTLINVSVVILIFAVSDRWLATAWPQYVTFKDALGGRLTGQTDFLYMSWTNLTTLGSNFTPGDIGAQALNIAEVTCGLLLLTVILAGVLASVRPVVRR
jgi:hypothetical protein